jgi:hypothetical protein
MFFRNRKLTISEAWNMWSLGFANAWNSGIVVRWRSGVTNMREPETSSWRWRELRKMADSGICRGPCSGVTREDMHESSRKRKPNSGICRGPDLGVTREDIHEPTGKQSQSCCPKKSGFWVWTSGRFVNMLDEKDILVRVHTRNIPWAWGCCRYVKVPSSPYKRGREGTCKQIRLFGTCAISGGNHSLFALSLCTWTC